MPPVLTTSFPIAWRSMAWHAVDSVGMVIMVVVMVVLLLLLPDIETLSSSSDSHPVPLCNWDCQILLITEMNGKWQNRLKKLSILPPIPFSTGSTTRPKDRAQWGGSWQLPRPWWMGEGTLKIHLQPPNANWIWAIMSHWVLPPYQFQTSWSTHTGQVAAPKSFLT